MKYKAGDRVKIKSLDWYNENKDEYGYIDCGSRSFFTKMSDLCGKIATIKEICKTNCYRLEEYDFDWTDEMIEGLVEEEVGLVDNLSSRWVNEFNLPDGYIFKDENGNVINATKIVLEKANTLKIQSNNMETETHRGYCTTEEETTNKSKKVAWFTFEGNDFADKVELALSNRELIQEDGKWFVVKKKKEYPKTYEECCKVLGVDSDNFLTIRNAHRYDGEEETTDYESDLLGKFDSLWELLICRDAYWKIAGEEMGLGKPWEPDWKNNLQHKHYISTEWDEIKTNFNSTTNKVLAFPTEEIRDAFKENFDPDIEFCKKLL